MSLGFRKFSHCKGKTVTSSTLLYCHFFTGNDLSFHSQSILILGSSGNVLYSLNKSFSIETFRIYIYSSWKKSSRNFVRFYRLAQCQLYLQSTQHLFFLALGLIFVKFHFS